jgi:hypothetical protein
MSLATRFDASSPQRCGTGVQEAQAQAPRSPGSQQASSRWRWVFGGGAPPPPAEGSVGPCDVLFTGHVDGRVRVWDATGEVPLLLAAVPFDSGGSTGRLRAVTCLEVALLPPPPTTTTPPSVPLRHCFLEAWRAEPSILRTLLKGWSGSTAGVPGAC